MKQVGGAETRLVRTHNPREATTNGKNITVLEDLPKEQGVQTPHWAPTLGRQTLRMSAFVNQWGLCLGEMEGYGKQTQLSEGMSKISHTPSPSTEAVVWNPPSSLLALGSYPATSKLAPALWPTGCAPRHTRTWPRPVEGQHQHQAPQVSHPTTWGPAPPTRSLAPTPGSKGHATNGTESLPCPLADPQPPHEAWPCSQPSQGPTPSTSMMSKLALPKQKGTCRPQRGHPTA